MPELYIQQLIDALRCLPGVGPRSAQRMAYHVLQKDKEGGANLAKYLNRALSSVRHCESCNTLTQNTICEICASEKRDTGKLCIVEMPVDVAVIEQTRAYTGLYFVLMGKLSPLDGVGPKELGLDLLLRRLDNLSPSEVVIATSFTSEGDATAHYINQLLQKNGISGKRLSRGLPVGGELEYSDASVIAQAFRDRVIIK